MSKLDWQDEHSHPPPLDYSGDPMEHWPLIWRLAVLFLVFTAVLAFIVIVTEPAWVWYWKYLACRAAGGYRLDCLGF